MRGKQSTQTKTPQTLQIAESINLARVLTMCGVDPKKDHNIKNKNNNDKLTAFLRSSNFYYMASMMSRQDEPNPAQ